MKKSEHHLLLVWLILIGLISFALFIAVREQALLLLYLGDSSKLSWVITLMFVIITLYCARRVWFISREITVSERVYELARTNQLAWDFIAQHIRQQPYEAGDAGKPAPQEGQIYLDKKALLPDCLLTRHLQDLCYQAQTAGADQAESNALKTDNKELIEVFEAKLKNPHNLGWFFTDIMIKLGLLGTIIGFVLMLGSVVNVTDFDVNTMQNILKQMSAGMGTALYTTFAGLVCSILTAAQFHLLDQAADELVDTAKRLTQLHILPKL